MASVGPFAFGGSDFSGNFTTDNGSFTESGGVLDSSTASDINRARVTSTAMDSSNHYIQADIGGRALTNNGAVTGRQASSTETMYEGNFVDIEDMSTGYRIRRITSGSETDIASSGSTGSSTPTAVTVRLDLDGSSQVMTVDTVEECSASDTNITSGTYVGVRVYNNNGGRFDNFEAADLSAGASVFPWYYLAHQR